jgi:hypothetical protein
VRTSEALVIDALAACDEVLQWIDITEDFKEACRAVKTACHQSTLAATDRRSHEGGAVISKRRDEPLRRLISSKRGYSREARPSMKVHDMGLGERGVQHITTYTYRRRSSPTLITSPTLIPILRTIR